jgi:hypothetical protein
VLPFTGGDALIYGHAISSEGSLGYVWPLMGLCRTPHSPDNQNHSLQIQNLSPMPF